VPARPRAHGTLPPQQPAAPHPPRSAPPTTHTTASPPRYVPFCGVAVLEELIGGKSGVEDPYALDVGSPKWTRTCLPHQEEMIASAAETLKIALLKP
jgi:hypothetical protein